MARSGDGEIQYLKRLGPAPEGGWSHGTVTDREIHLEDDENSPIELETEVREMGDYANVTLRPRDGWAGGETYQVRMTPDLRDVQHNRFLGEHCGVQVPGSSPNTASDCPTVYLEVRVRVLESELTGVLDDTAVRDVEIVGNILMAAASQGVKFLDISNPNEPENYFNGDLFYGLPSPLHDETGLIYMRNRYYDPDMGRFITPDPLGYVDGSNLYQFALNDPVNLSDPTGEFVPLATVGYMALSATTSVTLGMTSE